MTQRWREMDSNHRYPTKFFWPPVVRDIDRQTEPTAPEISDFSEADEKVLEQIFIGIPRSQGRRAGR
jgi:hypothetical protein